MALSARQVPVRRFVYSSVLILVALFVCSQCNASQGSTGAAVSAHDSRYSLHARGMQIGILESQFRWTAKGHYEYRSHSEAVGLAKLFSNKRVDQLSRGRWKVDALPEPNEYSYAQTGKKNKNKSMSFDRDAQLIRFRENGRSGERPLRGKVLDKLIYLLAIAKSLSASPQFIRLQVADGRKLKRYEFEVNGGEVVEGPLGSIDSVKVTRLRKGKKTRATEIWFAPSYDYLPVKVRHREKDGEILELLLQAYSVVP